MQAKHFLNAFWSRQAGGIPDEGFEKHQEKAEEIWNYTAEFIKLDKRKKDAGNELDEFEAHQFLEHTARRAAPGRAPFFLVEPPAVPRSARSRSRTCARRSRPSTSTSTA